VQHHAATTWVGVENAMELLADLVLALLHHAQPFLNPPCVPGLSPAGVAPVAGCAAFPCSPGGRPAARHQPGLWRGGCHVSV
jgi:hypothetical protein